jgi:hypothetical protein
MTKALVAEEDAKIRPQGFTKKVVIDAANLDDNGVELSMRPMLWTMKRLRVDGLMMRWISTLKMRLLKQMTLQ